MPAANHSLALTVLPTPTVVRRGSSVENFVDLHGLMTMSQDLVSELSLVSIELLWPVAHRMGLEPPNGLNSRVAGILATNRVRAVEALEWLIHMGGGKCPA